MAVEWDSNLYLALQNYKMAPVKRGLTLADILFNWKQDYWHWAEADVRVMEDLQKYRDVDKAEQKYYLVSQKMPAPQENDTKHIYDETVWLWHAVLSQKTFASGLWGCQPQWTSTEENCSSTMKGRDNDYKKWGK